ncbi:MAG: response regulator [Candidatus Omnitrophica bacterium]|nr:response regulator [Candidatus Omnitrophota bacterium]
MDVNNLSGELLFDLIPSAIFFVDINRNIIKWNKKAEEITGYSASEVLGKPFFMFDQYSCDEKCDLYNNNIKKPLIARDYAIRKKDGTLGHIIKSADLWRDGSGQIISGIEIFEDITVRKEFEVKIWALAEEWESAFNTFTDLIVITDIDNNIIRFNQAYSQAFNIEIDPSIAHGKMECVAGCPHQKSITTKKIETIETYDQKLGRFIEVTTCPLFNADLQVYRIVHIIKDISVRKKAEQLKDDLVSTVSHELRTPLTTIREAVSQVLDGLLGETTPEQREFLSMCLQDVDRLMRIINDLLDMSKIEAKRVDLDKQTIDFVGLIKQVQNTFTPRFREKQLEGKISFSHEQIEVYADRDKIIQVLTNLIGNALKFTSTGFVEISAVDKGDKVECAVIDSGKGIARQDIAKVFEKFKQVGRVYGPGEKGTGLGLAIAKGIVDLHKGEIWVESQEDKGTKFIFTLPKQTAAESIVIESIDRLLKFSRKEQKECTVFLISFHNFKTIEEKYGKERMDMILDEVFTQFKQIIGFAQPIIMKNKRQLVLLSDTGNQDVIIWKDKVKKIIKGSLLKYEDNWDTAFSCGYAVYAQDSDSAINLFEQAQNSLVDAQKEQAQKKILIVDDDAAVVHLLKDILSGFGYLNVISVNDGQDALAKIEEDIPDIMLLDMQMPRMNGYEVIGHLKEDIRTKDIPILIMSGQPVAFEKLNEYITKKAIPVIGKPFDIRQLKKLLWLLA